MVKTIQLPASLSTSGSTHSCDCNYAALRPKWARASGQWSTRATLLGARDSNGPDEMIRFKPSVNGLFEPLLGTPGGKRIHVQYPNMTRCFAIYRESIELLMTFRRREDVFDIAAHRQYVCAYVKDGPLADSILFDLEPDRLLFACMRDMRPAFTTQEWKRLAERLPKGLAIRTACENEAYRTASLRMAAE